MKNLIALIGAIGIMLLPLVAGCQSCGSDTLSGVEVAIIDTLPQIQCLPVTCQSCDSGFTRILQPLSGEIYIASPTQQDIRVFVIQDCHLVRLDTCINPQLDPMTAHFTATIGGNFGANTTVRVCTGSESYLTWFNANGGFPMHPITMDLDTLCTLPIVGIDQPISVDLPIVDIITGQSVTEMQPNRVYIQGKKRIVLFQ